MVHDEKSVGLFMSSAGKHGPHAHGKIFQAGQSPVPVVCASARIRCCSWPPAIHRARLFGSTITAAASEADPTISSKGEVTGLPFPAHAEIAIEGFLIRRHQTRRPFGEWLGYYGTRMEDTPVLRIERIYHRNDPILCVARPGTPAHRTTRFQRHDSRGSALGPR
jgi:4-hydroxy-3-polyprenylbenzoate decarboxylase